MRVLAALDDSELADEVVEALAPWLAAADAEARLLMVWDSRRAGAAPQHPPDLVVSDPVVTTDSWARAPVGYDEGQQPGEDRSQRIERIRNERTATLRALGESHLQREFEVAVEGAEHVPDAILRAASDYGADLIAIGTHGRRGLRRVLEGSVAEEVIRRARVPVFVVHQGSVRQPGARYLVVAHETARSEELREHIGAIAARDGRARFTLLIPATHAGGLVAVVDEAANAESVAAEARAVLFDAGVDLADAKVGDPTPLLAIEDELRAHPASYDAVILCTFPPGLSRWVRMDTAHQVERRLDIPVEHVIAYRAPEGDPRAREEYCQRLGHALETARGQLDRLRALSEGDEGIALPAREHLISDEIAALDRALLESGCR